MTTPPDDHWARRYYAGQVDDLLQRLRRLADEVEREAIPNDGPSADGQPRYQYAAERVNHAIASCLTNLAPYRLFNAARMVDDVERESS